MTSARGVFVAWLALATACAAGCTAASSQEAAAPEPEALAALWQEERRPLPPAPLVTHALLGAVLGAALMVALR